MCTEIGVFVPFLALIIFLISNYFDTDVECNYLILSCQLV